MGVFIGPSTMEPICIFRSIFTEISELDSMTDCDMSNVIIPEQSNQTSPSLPGRDDSAPSDPIGDATEQRQSLPEVELESRSDNGSCLPPLGSYFESIEYGKQFKLSGKCYIKECVDNIDVILHPSEMKWFKEHPQYKHFFHMPREPNQKCMGMWLLLVRTVKTLKQKEVWFVVNGVPMKYSLREMGLISGLNCQEYPPMWERKGSLKFVGKEFEGRGCNITFVMVQKKFVSEMEDYSAETTVGRLNMAVLYFLCSIVIGKKKVGKSASHVEPFFLRACDDLNLCKTFPWGRLAFDENMRDISYIMNKLNGNVKGQVVFPSFMIPLEFLAFEAIPALRAHCIEDSRSADPGCPRMCKIKLKFGPKKGFALKELHEKLGTTKDIQSILVANREEEALLALVMGEGNRNDDVEDDIVDGWTERPSDPRRKIWFEELAKQDVEGRKNVPQQVDEEVDEEVDVEVAEDDDEMTLGQVNEGDKRYTKMLQLYKEMSKKYNKMEKELKSHGEKIKAQDLRIKFLESGRVTNQVQTGTTEDTTVQRVEVSCRMTRKRKQTKVQRKETHEKRKKIDEVVKRKEERRKEERRKKTEDKRELVGKTRNEEMEDYDSQREQRTKRKADEVERKRKGDEDEIKRKTIEEERKRKEVEDERKRKEVERKRKEVDEFVRKRKELEAERTRKEAEVEAEKEKENEKELTEEALDLLVSSIEKECTATEEAPAQERGSSITNVYAKKARTEAKYGPVISVGPVKDGPQAEKVKGNSTVQVIVVVPVKDGKDGPQTKKVKASSTIPKRIPVRTRQVTSKASKGETEKE